MKHFLTWVVNDYLLHTVNALIMKDSFVKIFILFFEKKRLVTELVI